MMNSKKWLTITSIIFASVLLGLVTFVIVIDPYFHFHSPLDGVNYKIDNERYQNDGIVKHFEYDTIITGSSMTECFKASECDALFGAKSVKTSFAGGSFKEVGSLVKTGLNYNPNAKRVIWGIDSERFFQDKDHLDYEDYPEFLYDKNPINDAYYIFNMDVLFVALQDVLESFRDNDGINPFDEYANWTKQNYFGFVPVMNNYARYEAVYSEMKHEISPDEYVAIEDNITQNILSTAEQYPDVEFYLYYTPYSIYYMDYKNILGELDREIMAEEYITSLFLQYDNIHVFSFHDAHDIIENADNYRDMCHHHEDVNSWILEQMSENKHELTKENYQEYFISMREYYLNYNYEALYAQ